nr:T9SS type A sorting domain-containing protein [Bacteroidota bacterium]
MKFKNLLLGIAILIGFYSNTLYGQITRGAQPGEFYLSTTWYIDNYGNIHYAIFRSTDNGSTITMQYESSTNSPLGNMSIGKVLGDATSGAIYNYENELWISFDYGENWEIQEYYGPNGRFTSGCIDGEIYKCCVNVQGTIWRSEDYGGEFVEVTDNARYILEVGNNLGNVFGLDGSPGIGFNLHFSSDFAQNFVNIPIDSTIAFWAPIGLYPQISRGTEVGEIYIVSWWLDSKYKIFHSIDSGYNWTEKYESEFIDLYYWRIQYTAGKAAGSFYVMRSRFNETGDHVWLYIDYSNDYGQTFTTYFHDLDSAITGIKSPETVNIDFSNYPNPFSEFTTFLFKLPDNCNNPKLNIYNLQGAIIRQFDITNKSTQLWYGEDNKGYHVSKGIYLFNIQYNNFSSNLKKLLLIH